RVWACPRLRSPAMSDRMVAAGLLLGILTFPGFAITRVQGLALARLLAWGLMASSVSCAAWITVDASAPLRMLVVIGALFLSMKAVVGVEGERLPFRRWLLFCLLWPGMQPGSFAQRRSGLRGTGTLARAGALRVAAGIALVLAARVVPHLVVPLVLLPGLSLIVHFGVCDLLTAFWRR